MDSPEPIQQRHFHALRNTDQAEDLALQTASSEWMHWGERPPPEDQRENRPPKVPKIIWSYWHDGSPPDVVKQCFASWDRYAPDFTIRTLSLQTVETYSGPMPLWIRRRAPQGQSDWVRLKLLAQHGGLWLDSSIVLFKPLRHLVPEVAWTGEVPFCFFNRAWSNDALRPMVESWFIAAAPADPLIRKWLREYSYACIRRRWYLWLMGKLLGAERLFQGYPPGAYYTVFACLQAVLYRNPQLTVRCADSESGPYKLQKLVGYEPEHAAKIIASRKIPEGIEWIKLNGDTRRALIRMQDRLPEFDSQHPQQ